MFSKFLAKSALVLAGALAAIPAFSQYRYSTISLPVTNSYGGSGWSLSIGQSGSLYLPRRMFVHKVFLTIDATGGNAGAELLVNGDRKGNVWINNDPEWVITVEQETNSIEVRAIAALRSPQGSFNVRSARALVSDTDFYGPVQPPVLQPPVISPSQPPMISVCHGCERLHFPIYYKTVMGNVSNRAIMLVDRLAGYTNYADYGHYLLPIKKAAAEARAQAESRGDASSAAHPFFLALLTSLDNAQPYLGDTYERQQVFEIATELLALREHIRDILD